MQRVLGGLGLVIFSTLGILFLVYNERIFGWLGPLAGKWKHTTGGWIILWILAFITAFPPMIGYSACGTTAGFVYGVAEGWLIFASASVAGSFCSFLISRTVFRKFVETLVAHDKRFAALTLTLKHDGLKLLCMIRLCPLPYSLSNGAISTFPTVHPGMYALATAIVSPKLLVHVFIGSRLAAMANNGEEMSAGTKAVNMISILIGVAIGTFTGWYIYQRTVARARQLEAEETSSVRHVANRNGAAPTDFSDDPETHRAASTIAQGDNIDIFDDGTGAGGAAYKDDPTEDNDVVSRGDGLEESVISLRNQSK